ncbi:MAG: hypothetical protein IKE22_07820 [Atopobiaceae bacterium]|nr:hypothetical protein [Atopobiaceae bacterium]
MKRLLSTPIATALLLVLGLALIGYGGINGAQAAPRIVSEYFGAQVELSSIDTILVENGATASTEEGLLGASFLERNSLSSPTDFVVGKRYDESLSVMNNGDIDEYVRVTVTRYWTDAAGGARAKTSFDPAFIKLDFVTDGGWSIDEAASTEERTVLYYAEPIAPGAPTSDFVSGVTIDPQVAKLISQSGAYEYEGVRFQIDVTVDAVQTHNGTEAMTGAWGRTNS